MSLENGIINYLEERVKVLEEKVKFLEENILEIQDKTLSKTFEKRSAIIITTDIDANGDYNVLIKTLNANYNTLTKDTVVLNHVCDHNVIIDSDGNRSTLTKNAAGYHGYL